MGIARNIRTLRTDAGMTQQELADIVGLTREAVAQWENDIAMPRLGAAMKLAEHFGITLDELVAPSPEPTYQEKVTKSIDEIGITDTVESWFGFAANLISPLEIGEGRDGFEWLAFEVKGQGYVWNILNETLYINNAYGSSIFGYMSDAFGSMVDGTEGR